jgi:hypothetical protein
MSSPSDSENGSATPKEQVVFSFTELPDDPGAGLTDEENAAVVSYITIPRRSLHLASSGAEADKVTHRTASSSGSLTSS